jgi:predicted 2-oxoglutarate/Fe(II)-dependent dioxygenase YbiX
MNRILKTGDFLPDFNLISSNRREHTASLAGRPWILVSFADKALLDRQEFLRLIGSSNSKSLEILVACLAGSPQPSVESGSENLYEVTSGNIGPLVFGNHEASKDFCCMLIGANQKILERLDCEIDAVRGAIETITARASWDQDEQNTPIIPAIRIPSALPTEFCEELVTRYRQSGLKIQGRTGASNPIFDPSVKRVKHINADPQLGHAIDEHLVFSLLPAVERVFDFRVTHRVAYKISSYSADNRGFMAAHRDNRDTGTLFRKFALSIALNNEWEEGGISFPEYSRSAIKPRVGDALVFPASLMHSVEPVRRGERIVLLSFLYDEHAANHRRSQMKNPEILETTYVDAIDKGLLEKYNQFAPTSRFSPQY